VVQHEGAAISMYNFSLETGAMSKVPTHAWFPTGFFDEVDPAPANEGWLPECDGGGAWVFGRKGDGYVALYSARRVKWMRDDRFDDDPALAGPGKVKDGPFITTELRAEEGSNTWVCAVGTKAQYGSFTAFTEAVRQSYLHISGIGSLNQMECTFDMPRGVDATVGGYRLELFDRDDVARVDGEAIDLSAFPRFQNKYVSGRTAGRVEWDETSYRIAHPELRLWFEHNIQSATRTLGPRQAPTKPKVSVNAPGGIAVGAAARGIAVELKPVDTSAPARSRRRRFRLESSP